jgi:hypothetical protein
MVKLKMAPVKTFAAKEFDLKWGLIPIGLVLFYQFIFLFFGLDFSDSFYNINNFIRIGNANAEVNPNYFLSSYLGYYWSAIFGTHVLAFRTFNWVLNALLLLSPLLLIQRKDFKYFLVYFVITGIILAPIFGLNILGFDSFTNLFVVLSLVLLIRYISNPGTGLLLLLGGLSAVLIACRIPNLLIMPVIGGMLITNASIRNCSFSYIGKTILIYLVAALAAFALLVVFYYGSIPLFFDKLIAQLAFESKAGHETSTLLENYFRDFTTVLLYAGFIGFIYLINKVNYKNIYVYYLVKALSVVLAFVFYYKVIKGTYYNWQLVLLLNAFLISYVLIYIFEHLKEIRTSKTLVAAGILIFSFIPAFGSDTGLLKTYAVFSLFPFLLICYRVKYRKTYLGLLLVLVPIAVIDKFYVIYEDDPLRNLTETHAFERIDNIFTTPANVAYVKEVVHAFNGLKAENSEVIFYGNNSHLFNFLLKGSQKDFGTFKMDLDNANEIDTFASIGKSRRPAFIIVDRNFRENGDYAGLEKIDDTLRSLGYVRENFKTFVCYIPAEKK